MSINAIVNGTTYKDVSTIIVGDKSINLKQVQESSNAIDPWEGSLDSTGSIGYILNACEKAAATGTFEGGGTVSFDTGLGADIAKLIIMDESAEAFPTMNATKKEGVYLFIFDTAVKDGVAIFSTDAMAKTASIDQMCFNRAKTITFENGAFEYVPMYNGNELYNNFTPNHRYRWFAW